MNIDDMVRVKDRSKTEAGPKYTPCGAIHQYCMKKCNAIGHKGDPWARYWAVAYCGEPECELWPYRRGKNPSRRGIGGRPRILKG